MNPEEFAALEVVARLAGPQVGMRVSCVVPKGVASLATEDLRRDGVVLAVWGRSFSVRWFGGSQLDGMAYGPGFWHPCKIWVAP